MHFTVTVAFQPLASNWHSVSQVPRNPAAESTTGCGDNCDDDNDAAAADKGESAGIVAISFFFFFFDYVFVNFSFARYTKDESKKQTKKKNHEILLSLAI